METTGEEPGEERPTPELGAPAEPAPVANGAPSPEGTEDRLADEARALLGEIEAALADVAKALDHLESGSYGRCEVCGNPIPVDVLAEYPTARRCPLHSAGDRS